MHWCIKGNGMSILKSFVIAMAMYSKIPMPRVDWEEKNMRYALCFFPAVGFFEGALLYAAWLLLRRFGMEGMLAGAVYTVLPVLITGGIHADGFLDTMDALGSHQERSRKLEILKDSHTGAFAVMGGSLYFLLFFAGISQLRLGVQWKMFWAVLVLSRALSGLAIVFWKGAKKEGLMYAFASTAHKNAVRGCLLILAAACMAFMVWLEPFLGLLCAAGALAVFLYYRVMSYRQFGGITGDLAGFFVQLCELAAVYIIAFWGKGNW